MNWEYSGADYSSNAPNFVSDFYLLYIPTYLWSPKDELEEDNADRPHVVRLRPLSRVRRLLFQRNICMVISTRTRRRYTVTPETEQNERGKKGKIRRKRVKIV